MESESAGFGRSSRDKCRELILPMAANAELVPLYKLGQTLRPELCEFLDDAIVPALPKKFLEEESNPKKSLAMTTCRPAYSDAVARRDRRKV